MDFYIAQAISVLVGFLGVATMQFKNMKHILLGQLAINLLTTVSYFLLDGLSAAGICLVAIGQTLILYGYDRRQKRPPVVLMAGFILLYLACSVIYYRTFIDLFSALAAICSAVSLMQKKASTARRWYVFNPILWMVYDVHTRAYGTFVVHLAVLLSTVIAMIRVDRIWDRKHGSPTDEQSGT